MRSSILLVFLFIILAQNRVIQVTSNNVQLILRSLGQLHLLLHNPKCQHSKEYTQNFLRINNTSVNLGMADCTAQAALCNHLNVTRYPTLMTISNHSLEIIDEDLFLYDQNVLQLDDPRVALKNILKVLKKGDSHATIVLQEQQLPIIDKIQNNHQRNVFYIKNPSGLHTALYHLVGKQIGCWIISYKENQIQRYFCGTGYRSDELQKYMDSFFKGKLQRHIFTKQTNNTYIHYNQLKQIASDLGRKTKKCKFIYFYSKQCEHCSLGDFKKVKRVLSQSKVAVEYQAQIFDMDNEEFPKELALPRVPELVYFCYARSFYFGDVFTNQNIKKFLINQRNPFDKQQKTEKEQQL